MVCYTLEKDLAETWKQKVRKEYEAELIENYWSESCGKGYYFNIEENKTWNKSVCIGIVKY